MIKSVGEETLDGHDSANIPCNIFIQEIKAYEFEELDASWRNRGEEGDPPSVWAKWRLSSDYFMPRKGLADGCHRYLSSTREELSTLVREKILPSYKIAYDAVTALSEGKRDNFYYWTENE